MRQETAQNVSFYEFVRDYYPHIELDEKRAAEIEDLLDQMGHAGGRVSWNAVCQVMGCGVHCPAFGPRELRKMAEAAAAAKAPQPAKQKSLTRKRWESAAAFAKRMRKARN